MAIQKKVNGTWQPITPKKLKGIPYTGTLPAVLTGTKAGYLHRYKIYGNTEQTGGTPTPENPIYPSECGERTENIIDDYLEQAYISSSAQGVVSSYSTIDLALFPVEQGLTYTIQRFVTLMELYVGFFVSKPQIGSVTYDQTIHAPTPTSSSTFTFVAPITGWAAVRSSKTVSPKATVCVVEGSTAPTSYIPYGYKLPLLSGSTPVDIYIGESQTTRRIKKLVLTGEEDVGYDSAYTRFSLKLPDCLLINVRRTPAFCTHYEVIDDGRTISNVPDNSMYSHNAESRWYIKTTDYSTADAFKAYLQQQYAAGTPVTIWYILAEASTAAINEPLRKIGDYADTIESTQTSAQIPTTANSTTISWAGQGLAPSQFDSIAEWVSATPKIYTNGAWTDAQTYVYDDGTWVADN